MLRRPWKVMQELGLRDALQKLVPYPINDDEEREQLKALERQEIAWLSYAFTGLVATLRKADQPEGVSFYDLFFPSNAFPCNTSAASSKRSSRHAQWETFSCVDPSSRKLSWISLIPRSFHATSPNDLFHTLRLRKAPQSRCSSRMAPPRQQMFSSEQMAYILQHGSACYERQRWLRGSEEMNNRRSLSRSRVKRIRFGAAPAPIAEYSQRQSSPS